MANAGRHYEEAFEDFLAAEGIPYVPVTLAQRQAFQAARIKAFDFVVWPSEGPNWLVDIKGRVCRTGRLENWVTQGDVEGLGAWQGVFGEGFVGMYVFVYLVENPAQWPHQQAPLHEYQGSSYSFWSVSVDDYSRCARVRSAKWKTFSAQAEVFRGIADPVGRWLIGDDARDRSPFADWPGNL